MSDFKSIKEYFLDTTFTRPEDTASIVLEHMASRFLTSKDSKAKKEDDDTTRIMERIEQDRIKYGFYDEVEQKGGSISPEH